MWKCDLIKHNSLKAQLLTFQYSNIKYAAHTKILGNPVYIDLRRLTKLQLSKQVHIKQKWYSGTNIHFMLIDKKSGEDYLYFGIEKPKCS